MFHYSHLNTAARILASYEGGQPFGLYLKEFFRQDKKYGSRDRRQISHLCYCYFRLGRLSPDEAMTDRILTGLFLCSETADELLINLKPDWAKAINKPIEEKCSIAGVTYSSGQHFPFADLVSTEIDPIKFSVSHFIQPDLFIRVRPGEGTTVRNKLSNAGVNYRVITENNLAMPNSTKVDDLLLIDKEAVIQDESSQRVGDMIPVDIAGKRVWDCCAASGGKSILAVDRLGAIDLTVSDIRDNILHNLRARFVKAGISRYKSFVADLGARPLGRQEQFDLILADVPCSGSGTWGRTPEHLRFFAEEKIWHYSSLQKKIIDNCLPSLVAGGSFLYITCSVYRAENEEAVDYISNKGLRLVNMNYFKGYERKADTMFAALFTI
ncbi:MAG: Fmu (Sun) domain-containing protein [Chitinophagaceae bacterium]